MDERKPTTQKGDSALCLLCNRLYCELHKGTEEDVCEINHATYNRNHQLLRGTIFPNLLATREKLGEKEEQAVKTMAKEKEETKGIGS